MHYPTSFQAVDIIVRKGDSFLFGRKNGSDKFQCLGGFVDPDKDKSLELAARRELIEEASYNMESSFPEYRFSFRVDDERYRESEHKIMSAVFVCHYLFGIPVAQDDIKEVKWFSFKVLKEQGRSIFVEKHFPIIDFILKTYEHN